MTRVAMRSGLGSTLKVTSVRKPSVPQEPAMSFTRSRPGDVLHHPPAGLHHLAAPVDEAHADQAVAGGARHDPARAGDVHGRDRPDGRLALGAEERAVIHRLEGQLLPLRGKRRARPPSTGVPARAAITSSAGS